jgi:ADP-ribosylglycohydrolase
VPNHIYSNFFKKAIQETVALAGDTNTNALIVSGILGAAIGIQSIY